MPLVTISMIKGRKIEFKKLILAAVHASLVTAFKIPDHDRNQRIIEIEPDNLEYPQGKSENFVTIEMTVFPGRSIQAKRSLYQEIVSRLHRLDIQGDDIQLYLMNPILKIGGFEADIQQVMWI